MLTVPSSYSRANFNVHLTVRWQKVKNGPAAAVAIPASIIIQQFSVNFLGGPHTWPIFSQALSAQRTNIRSDDTFSFIFSNQNEFIPATVLDRADDPASLAFAFCSEATDSTQFDYPR